MLEHPISNCKDRSKVVDGTCAPNYADLAGKLNGAIQPRPLTWKRSVERNISVCLSSPIYRFLITFPPQRRSLPLPHKVRAGRNSAAVREALSDPNTSHFFKRAQS